MYGDLNCHNSNFLGWIKSKTILMPSFCGFYFMTLKMDVIVLYVLYAIIGLFEALG